MCKIYLLLALINDIYLDWFNETYLHNCLWLISRNLSSFVYKWVIIIKKTNYSYLKLSIFNISRT